MPITTSKPAEHAPTPWREACGLVYAGKVRIATMDGKAPETSPTQCDANAAFIIKACNAHAGLVEALAGLVGSLDDENKAAPWAVLKAKAALAQAMEDKG